MKMRHPACVLGEETLFKPHVYSSLSANFVSYSNGYKWILRGNREQEMRESGLISIGSFEFL